MGAQLRTLVGGEVADYTRPLSDSRNHARERMWGGARAYGTAVTVEPIQPPLPRAAPDGNGSVRATTATQSTSNALPAARSGWSVLLVAPWFYRASAG